jgi:arylsulfatase A-like enzyme
MTESLTPQSPDCPNIIVILVDDMGQPGAWELYNMDEDRTELHDLAARNRDRLRSFVRHYEEWAARCEVRPWPL